MGRFNRSPPASPIIPMMISCMTVALSVLPGFAQTFDFTADTFRTRLNERIKTDGGGSLKSCSKSTSALRCTFDDEAYQQSVAAFKDLDLANGRFNLKQAMEITTKGGRVGNISLTGTRSDPMNLFHFIGTVGSILGAFEPEMDSKSAASLILELGLMRGDDDSTIGTQKTLFRKSVAVDCNQYPSTVSLKVECVFGPRY